MPTGRRQCARARLTSGLTLTVLLIPFLFIRTPFIFSQTANTGSVTGVITDSSGAVVAGAKVTVTNEATAEARTVMSGDRGSFVAPLLLPGSYRMEVSKPGFKVSLVRDILVSVTETQKIDIHLTVGQISEEVNVTTEAEQVQTESSALGRVTTGDVVSSLPLVTRNYTQIIALSPGVSSDLTNAGELGRGGGGSSSDPFVANGVPSADNNFQMNGVEINDLQQGTGVAIPNPDTIQEFKVQTGQYDASYGRDAGANVDVITKGGSNSFHGDVFEYFRNEDLNANEFFRNQGHQPRAILRQNQFGFTLGGPVKKDKLLFFTSYQGTRQLNGVDVNCSSNFATAPLTNDRSAAALGALFSGQPTFAQMFGLGGPSVLPDGSNISPQALALLNLKLPNGQFVIPTPQRIDPSQPFASQGISAISNSCPFNENQFMINGDWRQSERSKLSARFFSASSTAVQTLPGPNLGGPAIEGFPLSEDDHFRNFSLTHYYTITSHLLNLIEISYHRQLQAEDQHTAFHFSDIGVNAPAFDNAIPEIAIQGGVSLGGNGQGFVTAQNTYVFQDNLSWVHGRHAFKFGGGVTRAQDNFTKFHYIGGLIFETFPDFLLGQDGITNGTGLSNIILSIDLPGLFDRYYRVWDGELYAQDDVKVTSRLTLNLGFRYERLGDLGDTLGRNSIFNFALANPNPPSTGSFNGFVVADNYKGRMPAGVTRVGNNLGINGDGQNTLNPRFGFAWQIPGTNRLALRGGYGVYHLRLTGQPLIQLLTGQPFAVLRDLQAFSNASASFANPFPLSPPALPSFTPYSPTTLQTTTTFAPNFRPPIYQRYSLNLQTQLAKDFMLEVGYAGTRGTHQIRERSLNQALLASPSNPIRGETTNTVANIPLRVPIEGFTPDFLVQIESEGGSWYNDLETSLSKRFTNGLQFLVSYTYSRDLTTDLSSATGPNGGFAEGDQNNPRRRYGPDYFVRPHRFVASYVYEFPNHRDRYSFLGQVLGGWKIAGVTTIQSGHLLSAFNTNANNLFGMGGPGEDFAQVIPGCRINSSGAIQHRLNNYINTNCFSQNIPVIGDDGIGTAFGNSGVGIIRGPDQVNTDFSLIKQTSVKWPSDAAFVEFRAEFFNVFNHPQFSDPVTEQDASTFGQIQSTAVNPRVMQLALKLNF